MLKMDIGVGGFWPPLRLAGDLGGVAAWLLGLRTSENPVETVSARYTLSPALRILSIARLTAGEEGATLGPEDVPRELEERSGVWMETLDLGLAPPAWLAFTRLRMGQASAGQRIHTR